MFLLKIIVICDTLFIKHHPGVTMWLATIDFENFLLT